MPIEEFEQHYLLGVPRMDDTHREFVDLLQRMQAADKARFIELFAQLQAHTEAHFEIENALMRESAFPAVREHMDEHQRVLGELRHLARKVAEGSLQLGRAYVRQQLPAWFRLHAVTMDSALAAHLKHHRRPLSFDPATLH
jgi:hemerythrin-like metal-binding protein